MRKHISIFALLLSAFAVVGSAAGAVDRQMVNGGYYFIEGKDPSQQSAERMSINGDGRSYATPYPGLTEGDEVTFKASPEPGLRTAEWGTLIHANQSTDARNYAKYNKWTVAASDSYTWSGKPADGTGYLAVNFKYIVYNVRYDANGGKDAPDPVNGKRYDTHFNLPSTTPTKAGFDFSGWKPDTKTDQSYSAGQEVSGVDLCSDDWHEDGKTVTLRAQWTGKSYTVTYQSENCTLTSQPSPGTYDQPLSIAWIKDADVGETSTVTVYDGADTARQILQRETNTTTFDFKMSDLGKYYESVVIKVACTKNVRHDLMLKKGDGVKAITWKTNDCDWVRSETDVNLPDLLASTTWAVKVEDVDVERGYDGPSPDSGTMSVDVTRTLKGTPHQYIVDYDLQGGEKSGDHYPVNATFEDSFYVSAPTRTDRTFLGWIVVTNKDDLACAKWGTSARDVTHDVLPDTPCANGATGDVFFKNLTSIKGEKIWLEAKWSGQTHTIAVTTDPKDAGSASGGGEIEDGATATLTATPNAGYSFCCWTNGNEVVSTDNPWTFTVTADEIYTAVFTGNVYTVTYKTDGGKPKDPTRVVTFGAAYGEPPSVSQDGYELEGWYTESDGEGIRIDPDTKVFIAENHKLWAHWTEKTEFDVTFVDSIGKRSTTKPYPRDQPIGEAPEETKAWDNTDKGYWQDPNDKWDPPLTTVVTDDMTVTAKWISVSDILDCTNLTFTATGSWKPVEDQTAEGGWCMRMDEKTGTDNLTATLKESGILTFHWKGDTGRVLYVNHNWETNFTYRGSGWQEETIPITIGQGASIDLQFTCRDPWLVGNFCAIDHVTWTPGAKPVETYAVTYDKGTYGEGEWRTDTKTNGVDLVLAGALFTRDNYTQDGWSKNEDGSTSDYALGGTYTENAAITLYPHWLENGKYTVSYSAGTDATGSAASQTAHIGETVVLHGDGHFSRTGYSQDGWATSDLGEKAFEFSATYEEDVSTTLYPCWTNNRYTVTFNPNGGSVTPEPQVVTYDESYGELPTLDDREGYKFIGWTLASGDLVSAETIVKTAADHELTAKWTKNFGPYSEALDCDKLKFELVTDGWFFCNETPHKGDSCLRSATSGAELTATITESGTLTFWWRGEAGDDMIQLEVTGNVKETLKIYAGDPKEEWEPKSIDITASAEAPVTFKFTCGSRFDGTCDIDDVTWTPEGGGEPTPGNPVAVTAAGVEGNVFSLTIPTDPGTDYGVWTNADLTVDSWGLMGEPWKGDGNPWKVEWTILPEFPQLFFRAHKVEYK